MARHAGGTRVSSGAAAAQGVGLLHCCAAHLDVAVTTKYRSGRDAFSMCTTASLPTPLGPLMTRTTGLGGGSCVCGQRAWW